MDQCGLVVFPENEHFSMPKAAFFGCCRKNGKAEIRNFQQRHRA